MLAYYWQNEGSIAMSPGYVINYFLRGGSGRPSSGPLWYATAVGSSEMGFSIRERVPLSVEGPAVSRRILIPDRADGSRAVCCRSSSDNRLFQRGDVAWRHP